MSKDDWIYVGHMLDMSRKAVAAIVGKSREVYDRDEILRMALTHFIQVIGEAARKEHEASVRRRISLLPAFRNLNRVGSGS